MKIAELIAQLQAMPQDADVEIYFDEEYCDFTIEQATDDAAPHLVAILPAAQPPHIAEINAKYQRIEEAAPDLLAALKTVTAHCNLSDEFLAPARAAIAKAEG